ncbi:MAG TPA: protein-glutamate O-methyltransferase CheR [Candidatus Sphingobacterium stercoripullorum]|nr:protein-glutamate O-methyltransferase CheR [Candidatus Sphingobacterium stercoripullorum]
MAELTNQYTLTFEELEKLIAMIKNSTGYDFTGYSRSSLKRRFTRIMMLKRLSVFDLQHEIINSPEFVRWFIDQVTVNVTEMFRDPHAFKALKELVFPYLKSFAHIKIWSAGCATGEEAYSLAILLKLENLYDRSFIYGTDISNDALQKARKGIYNLKKIQSYIHNFQQYSDEHNLSDYYTVDYNAAAISAALKSNIFFSNHNLATDYVFNEFQLILCRNVLIYFNLELQNEVLKLFYDSLSLFGFICLGSKETMRNFPLKDHFRVISKEYNIYQKIK